MLIGEEEKPARKAALDALKAMLSTHTSKKLESIKKPAVAVEVEGAGDAPEEEGMEEGEPSEEDKMKIAELYNKFCK